MPIADRSNLRPLKTQLAVAAAIIGTAALVASAASGAPPPRKDNVMRDLASSRPPSWIKWLGWATDGTRIAWRQGPHGTGNVPGKPIWIARLGERGAIVDRHYRRTQLQKALDSRGIRRRPQAVIEEVTPLDNLIKTNAGEVYAVVVRGNPPILAILRRAGTEYKVVARRQVLGPVDRIRVNAAEQPAGRLMAVVAHTGRLQRRQANLFIIPLQPAAFRGTKTKGQASKVASAGSATALPKAVTPVAKEPVKKPAKAPTSAGRPNASARTHR